MKTILILMDTLQRKMVHAYEPDCPVITPNIDRLAKRCAIFDRHFIGSAPCMPARRDILTGRLNFLERNWGAVEPFDVTMPALLKKRNVFSHIVTDHCHYMELGGEGYVQQYNTWELIRGQETDAWDSRIRDPEMPSDYLGRVGRQYQCNRQHFKTDADYPTPRTFAAAADWLKNNEGADNFFLQVEVFDPHEPFDAAQEFLDMYPDDFPKFYEWPRYAQLNEDETPEAIRHLRNRYMATLSMADKWLGKLLDEMDRQNLWEDTMVIFTSDHGHMLGEHNRTGKNDFHAWNEMAEIPLFIHLPGDKAAGQRFACLTQNIDLFPTILDWFGEKSYLDEGMYPIHGKSLLPVLGGETDQVRQYALYGWFGKPVNITDGHYTYFRAANEDNKPLYWYGSVLTTYARYFSDGLPTELIDCGNYLEWTKLPVYRINLGVVNAAMEEKMKEFGIFPDPDLKVSMLFDIDKDNDQLYPIHDQQLEERFKAALVTALREHQSPEEQLDRLNLR